jgi:heme A synthase
MLMGIGAALQISLGFFLDRGNSWLRDVHASIGFLGVALVAAGLWGAWRRKAKGPALYSSALMLVLVAVQAYLGVALLGGVEPGALLGHEVNAFLILAVGALGGALVRRESDVRNRAGG